MRFYRVGLVVIYVAMNESLERGLIFHATAALIRDVAEYRYIGAVNVELDYRSCVLLKFQNLKLGSYI